MVLWFQQQLQVQVYSIHLRLSTEVWLGLVLKLFLGSLYVSMWDHLQQQMVSHKCRKLQAEIEYQDESDMSSGQSQQ